MLQKPFLTSTSASAIWNGRSFYQDLGFTKVNDFTLDDSSVGDALGLKAKKLRGVFMRLATIPTFRARPRPIHRPATARPALRNPQQHRHLPDCLQRRRYRPDLPDLQAKKVEFVAPRKKSRARTGLRSAWSASKTRMARSWN